MANYAFPVDIGNRALQHCGATRVTAADFASPQSKNAAAIAFAYDKVRQAELRRNVWRFAIRKAALRAIDWSTMFLVPAAYTAANTYPLGAVVLWNSVIYFATQAVPVSTPPDQSPTYWTVYFGAMNVTPWVPGADPNAPALWNDAQSYTLGALVTTPDGTIWQAITSNVNQNPVTTANVIWEAVGTVTTLSGYYAGELVYVVANNVVTVFMSLQNGNIDDPTELNPWSATQTYFKGETVSLGLQQVYFDGTQVLFEGSSVYYNAGLWESTVDLNMGNTPGSSSEWQQIPSTQTDIMAGQNWLQLDATVVHQRINYPLQSGPRGQASTRNVFRLPNGYLNKAPQDPKAGVISYLGAPSGMPDDSWAFEGNWLVTPYEDVIILRFVADIADVTQMDLMFCEGLAASIGMEVCEELTQSQGKLQEIEGKYKMRMGEARAVNGIETGSVEPPLDDYISCRW